MAEDIYEVDQIIGRRITSNGKEDYLVRWQSYSPLLSTWEPIGNFNDCHRAIKEFYDKHWPIPGTKATGVVRVAEKPNSAKEKQELLTLQALPAIKGKRLFKGLPKDLKEEILRLQSDCQSSLENRDICEVKEPLTLDSYLGQSNMRFNGESEKNDGSVKTRKGGMKRKKDDLGTAIGTPQQPAKISKRNNPKYLSSFKEKHKQPKKSPHSKTKNVKTSCRRAEHLVGNSSSPKECKSVFNNAEAKAIQLPARLTRQTLPNCPAILEEELVVTKESGCIHIKLCNEGKKNVINLQMCEKIISSLHSAGRDDISLVVIVGSGGSFCYGWDLDQFKDMYQAERKDVLQKYRLMTRMLITCPKPLIAAVNGPAAGFGVALAGLCDIVLASDKATFHTKFAEWGHPPIGCCSYILPHHLGSTKAMSMLLLNRKISAVEANQSGLVSEVLKTTHFAEELRSIVQKLRSIPTQCLRDTKTLLHENKVQELANVNEEECDFFQKYIVNDTSISNILTRWKASIEE